MKVTKQYLKKLIKESLQEVNVGSGLNLQTVFSQQAAEQIQTAYQALADSAVGSPSEMQQAQELVNYLRNSATLLEMFAEAVEGAEQEAEALKNKLNIK